MSQIYVEESSPLRGWWIPALYIIGPSLLSAEAGLYCIRMLMFALKVPAGVIDGPLCCFWLYGILNNTWYRYPTQLAVSALHAFGALTC